LSEFPIGFLPHDATQTALLLRQVVAARLSVRP